jgi:ABC-type transport system involved in multi-copper enzyme maturation permease subunit
MMGASARDVLEVARFEVARALRSWSAAATLMLFVIVHVGGAVMFVELLRAFESEVGGALGVTTGTKPGAMLSQLRHHDSYLGMIEFLSGGSRGLSQALAATPPLALFVRWLSLHLVPLLVVFSASEAISADVAPRTLRFEALRTGRAEIVAGRMLGQFVVLVGALLSAFSAVYAVGLMAMVGIEPGVYALALLLAAAGSAAASLPYLGLALAVSQFGTSSAWSRALGLAAWVALSASYLMLRWLTEDAAWADALLPLFPQDWIGLYWRFGVMPWLAAAVHVAQGVLLAAVGFVNFARRDL